jgi:hypothetical protein
VPPDIHGVRIGIVLVALLVMPLGRIGLAPSCLSRNRHR